MATPQTDVLYAGKFLELVKRGRWEYARRPRGISAAFIGAVTPEGKMILVEEFRVPMDAWIIGCPAGLIGDTTEGEALRVAVARELVEEAGYEPDEVLPVSFGPTSPGLTDECIHLVLARKLRKVGPGGGIDGELIRLHEIPLDTIDAWLRDRVAEGRLIDPKVYAMVYFVRTTK